MKLLKIATLIFCLSYVQAVLAVETGTALKADAIKKEPFADAKTIATLALGDKVTIVNKDGGWLSVKSAKGNGWVRMLSIRRGDAAKAKGVAQDVTGLASGRAGTGKIIATTGIRGLSEEELKSAKFNADELKLLETFASTRAEAQNFASQGKLKSLSLDYLPLDK